MKISVKLKIFEYDLGAKLLIVHLNKEPTRGVTVFCFCTLSTTFLFTRHCNTATKNANVLFKTGGFYQQGASESCKGAQYVPSPLVSYATAFLLFQNSFAIFESRPWPYIGYAPNFTKKYRYLVDEMGVPKSLLWPLPLKRNTTSGRAPVAE